MKKLITISTITLMLISGCATIVADDDDRIKVTSNNNMSFKAKLNEKEIDVPSTVVVDRNGDDLVITTNQENCDTNTPVEKKMDTAFLGNLITGGAFGSTTDASTGKMWDYQSDVTIICR